MALATTCGTLALRSAAMHHGLSLWRPTREPEVYVPRGRKVPRDRRRGIRLIWADLPDHHRETAPDGTVRTTAERTVVDCAARLPLPEGLAIAESALRRGLVTMAELTKTSDELSRRQGAPTQRVVLHLASAESQSVLESATHAVAYAAAGDRFLKQCPIPTAAWRHGTRDALVRDCERVIADAVHHREELVGRFGRFWTSAS